MAEPLGLSSLLPRSPDSSSLGPVVYPNTHETPACERLGVEHPVTRWSVG